MGIRAYIVTILCLFSGAGIGAFDLKDSKSLSISDIPSCGISCLLYTVPASGCDLSNTECQCNNKQLAHTLSRCMLANCTMADIQSTAMVQAELCRLSEESKHRDVLVYTGSCYSIAILFVILRFIGKATSKRLSWDDWIILAAMSFTTVSLGCILRMAQIGFGEHLWNLEPGQLLQNLRLFYVAWSVYILALGLIKVSLVMFYLEIFPSPRPRLASFIVLAYIIINTLVIFFLTIFNCIPIDAFWNRDIKTAKCMDITILAYANSVSAIAQDVILLILPLACIRKLNMKRIRKIAVGTVFSIGTFGCTATIIRLHSLLTFKTTIDPTFDYVPVTVWTEIELACGFVCVSLPAIRLLLVRLVPTRLLASITSQSRTRNTRPPGIDSGLNQEKWKASWLHVPTMDNCKHSAEWPSKPTHTWPYSQGHRRLGSTHGSETSVNLTHVTTTTLPVKPEKTRLSFRSSLSSKSFKVFRRGREEEDTPVVPKVRRRQKCKSCEGEYVTALPQIGCLPDVSYSQIDIRRHRGKKGVCWDAV